MSACLLDTNVLIALAWPVHVHHVTARAWFDAKGHKVWATCPLTQCAFVRISSNPAIIRDAVRPEQALQMLQIMARAPGHRFWSDGVSMGDATFGFTTTLTGHRQVTDAYLLALARENGGRVATFDRGLVALAGGAPIVELIA